ncbi:MAG: GNAT family N-acetyltransferase [Oligoflexia bacterium]|nr:GNAT family N-acetyltransferase [Oligoflexia bacterium]
MRNIDFILKRLRENPGPNLRAIDELTNYLGQAKIFSIHENDSTQFAYLLISGHPSTRGRSPSVLFGGNPKNAKDLLKHLPQGPYTVLETPKIFLDVLEGYIPKSSEIYHERRMSLTKKNFHPVSSNRVRKILESDELALAKFFGAPPQAAQAMRGWINGAKALFGIFENDELVSLGSTYSAIPEGWSLVSIKTLDSYRRRGLSAEVTSALCEAAFKEVENVELTVLSDNQPAIGLYKKLGFILQEERVWIDCGSGSKPFF